MDTAATTTPGGVAEEPQGEASGDVEGGAAAAEGGVTRSLSQRTNSMHSWMPTMLRYVTECSLPQSCLLAVCVL